jgi:hypothetical protein
MRLAPLPALLTSAVYFRANMKLQCWLQCNSIAVCIYFPVGWGVSFAYPATRLGGMCALPKGSTATVLCTTVCQASRSVLLLLLRVFAVTGAMSGAWFKATNQSLSFSEQQIMDCG